MHLQLPFNWAPEEFLSVVFGILIVVFLFLDLGVFQKGSQKVKPKYALWQSIIWITVSLLFCLLIYVYVDRQKAGAFLLAYFTEKALSVDNIFVWLIILQFFDIEERYYHRILFYGVIGAIIFRGIFIFTGFLLIQKFHWIIYIFGALLIYSGFKLLKKKEEVYDPEGSWIYGFLRKRFRLITNKDSSAFMVKKDGKWYVTTMFLTLALIETTDIVFALDSIPAVLGISRDKFVVYTSNIFAVLGLRAMFFLISGFVEKFRYLKFGLSLVLIFIGLKMFAEYFDIHLPIWVSLVVVIGVLSISIIASLMAGKKHST